MTKDDVLFGYRQALFAEAARTNVSQACRRFGVHRSTYYAWKREVDRSGLEMLRPRERRRPKMPNQMPKMVEERILAFSIAHPGLGPRRVASELRRPKWGGIVVSPNGVWKVLCRHGLNTRAKRLGLIAGYAAPYEPPRDPGPERHIDVSRSGELVGIDCFSSAGYKASRDRAGSSPRSTSFQRVQGRLHQDGGEVEGSPPGIHAGRPQTNGNVEALHRTILDELWRPSFARYRHPRISGLRRELETYLSFYNFDRVHHGRLTAGQIPADIVYGARKMEVR